MVSDLGMSAIDNLLHSWQESLILTDLVLPINSNVSQNKPQSVLSDVPSKCHVFFILAAVITGIVLSFRSLGQNLTFE